jgi:uncharacterized membrane protein YhaH (DUF805 family)
MNFGQAISSCFQNYANFSDRASRPEFWYWYLFTVIVLTGIDLVLGHFSVVSGIVALALILPSLAVGVRRLHDIDRTGWWILIGATVIGTLVLIYWACLPGTPGDNRFGKI